MRNDEDGGDVFGTTSETPERQAKMKSRMKALGTRLVWVAVVIASVVLVGRAQDRKAATDPRVGLKAGLKDAGQVARNIELVTTLPKPAGFFDPGSPMGGATAPERPDNAGPTDGASGANAATPSGADAANPSGAPAQQGAAPSPPPFDPKTANQASFLNSDLAFDGHHLFLGNYNGFNVYDIEEPKTPRLLAAAVCPGGQGDVSVYKNLLFMSVEQVRGRLDCGTQGNQTAVSTERFRGVRIFDISDIKKPRQVAAVQSCRGSHTHTLVTDPKNANHIYVYGSGTGPVRSGDELAGCSDGDPKDNPETALFSIDVIEVPLAAPQNAKIVNRPRIFADPATGNVAGLWQGGNHGEGTQSSRRTNQCHDITVFPSLGLAAGACSGNGILMDISDPEHPVRLDHVVDKNFAYWHSATFNNDGTKIVFTDEWGGGARPRCRAIDPPTWGADAIFDIVDRKLVFRGYYKMPAPQTEQENCVAHNGSLIPVPGRDIMVQAWYQGGLSVFDFSDSAHPFEIAYFDRGPVDAKQLYTGGYWSTYWYNGHIYGAEIIRGLDVFRLKPSEFLSQSEITAAVLVQSDNFNAQQQPRIVWPASSVVARAYLDQLGRTHAIASPRANAVRSTLDHADSVRSASDKGAAAVADQLDGLATQIESDGSGATGRDAARFKALADTLRGRATRLR
jgi:hypothetical protein